MGMISLIGRLSQTDLQKVLENQKYIDLLLNDGVPFDEPKLTFLQRLFGKKKSLQESWKPDEYHAQFDLDKSWHAIHFTLTGDAEGGDFPLCFLLMGGQDIGEDLGYGPARCLLPAEVAELGRSLEALSIDSFRSRYNAKAMNENDVYPVGIWNEEESEWLAEVYGELKNFVKQAADNSQGMYIALL